MEVAPGLDGDGAGVSPFVAMGLNQENSQSLIEEKLLASGHELEDVLFVIGAVLCCAVPLLCCAVLCCTVLRCDSAVLRCAVLYCAVLCCAVTLLCCAVPCCAALCCGVL